MQPLRLAKRVLLVLLVALPVLLIAAAAFAAGPTGAGPNDALMVPTGPQTIAPNSTLWFYFDYTSQEVDQGGFGGRGGPRGGHGAPSGGPTHPTASVAVDANGVGGLAFGIYTPDQANAWVNDPTTAPVGQGTPYRDTSSGLVTHDLYWSGGFNISGRYYVAVTNSNPNLVTFNMTVTGDTVMLYPTVAPSPTPSLPVPFTPVPVTTGTIQGKIVFETATGGDIYTVNGDGSNLTRVTYGIDPSWAPGGKQIVFARWDNTNPGIFIANADRSNEQLLFGTPMARWPRISPDGQYVLFSQQKSPSSGKTVWKLGLVNLATGKFTEPQCSQLCFVPSWGPDSATIVFTDPNIGIMMTNAFKGQETQLGPTGTYWDSSANIPRPIVHWPPMQDSDFSPNGQQIVYSMQAQDRWELNIMNSDGSGQSGITNPDPVLYYLMGVAVHNVSPIWSPDNQQILYLSDRTGQWGFFVVNPDGTNPRQVLTNVTNQVPLNFSYNNERMMDWTQ